MREPGQCSPVELLMEGVRNPQLLALSELTMVWLEKQQQSLVSMGMYTGLWARLHPEIHPGLGTGSCCCPVLPACPGWEEPGAKPGTQCRGSGQPLQLHRPPRLCHLCISDGTCYSQPVLGTLCHTTGLVKLSGAEGEARGCCGTRGLP